MEDIKKNNQSQDDVEEEHKHMGLENFPDFNANNEYTFVQCENCDGPILGHIEVKCGSREGDRYEVDVVRSFENWIKRIPALRVALIARNQNKVDIISAKIGEYVKIAIESAEKKNRPEVKATQLMKPRTPPLWSGQEYDRWKIKVEKWYDNNKSTDEEKYNDLLESLKRMML